MTTADASLEPLDTRAEPGIGLIKVPPHSIEAEQAVLGGLMLENSAWDEVADGLTEADFYYPDHQVIFRAIMRLAETNQPFDVITLSDHLKGQGELKESSALAYLGRLARDTPSAANIQAYARIVRDHSILRQLVQVGTHITESGYGAQGRDIRMLLDEAEAAVFHIADTGARAGAGFKSIQTLIGSAVDYIHVLEERNDPITGIPSGFTDFDEKTAGLQPGDLIIIAGRPSMGKTSFALNIAQYAAVRHKAAVAVFSMEMPGQQLAMRLLSSLGRIDQHRLRTGRLSPEDGPRLSMAVAMLSEVPLHIDDSPALTPTEVRARARRLKRSCDLKLIVIDYLQLMRAGFSSDNRVAEISEISRSLKALARELNVPVIALSQLNRSLENRPNKRPVMSDLRESGAIEQDADLIVFIYRDEVYNKDSEHKGTAEIIIAKQRNGPIGEVTLTFLGPYTSFENFHPEVYSNEAFA